MRRFICVAAFIALSVPALATAGDLVVVVNKTNPVGNITKAQLKRMMLGEQASWGAGRKVSVILRSPGQPEREGVLRSICGMSEDDFNQHLMHANFNGDTGGAPKALSAGAAVRQLVAAIPGAIGFLRPSDVNESVKAITVDGIPAGEPGYNVKEGK